MLGEVAALAASATWAVGTHLFARVGKMPGASPGVMNLGKCATALACFAVTSLVLSGRVFPSMASSSLRELLVSGFVGLALGDGCYFAALMALGPRRAILLLSTAPVWTAIGGAFFLGEALSLRDAIAILAVMSGVALVVREQVGRADRAPVVTLSPKQAFAGVLFGVGAGVGQAGGALLSRRAMLSGVTALDAALVRLCGGLAGLLVLALLAGKLRTQARALFQRGGAPPDHQDGAARPLALRALGLVGSRLLGAIAASALVGTFCGIWLAQFAIGHASSTAIASTLLATSPIFALPLGRFLASEPITPRAIAGTLVACGGLAGLTLK